ncbi:hypothetical protein V474_13420 [Novosphingobium barchaimii LL02]|uniref:Uncharacterized protein n=1 Tax=Novosphingobium barchaimii LL02 TaxID=1114963 RepID=A0A0J7XZF9_9SPHN|nr:hypothetical protein V474_13420 [Novosphingobium barchaimii LL02]
MRRAEFTRTVAGSGDLFRRASRLGRFGPADEPDAGGGGLSEPSTDAPADTDLLSMPAGFVGRLSLEQCHDA